MFCLYFGLDALPSSVNVLTLYAQFLSRSFKSVQSIQNYISGVKILHLFTENKFPEFDLFHLKQVFKGLARLNPHCPKRAYPVSPYMLLQFRELFNLSNPFDATFWCLFLHAFFLMFRKSNLVPSSKHNFDPTKQLCRSDILFDSHKRLLLVKTSWSKTIQFGERSLIIPLVEISDSPLCPVKAYLNMTSLVPASDSSPAFCLQKRGKLYPVTYRQMQRVLKALVKNLGLDPSNYSSHSFRRGGATWAFSSEVPSELIQLYGDWRSDAYKKYLCYTLENKIAVAEKMKTHILKSV